MITLKLLKGYKNKKHNLSKINLQLKLKAGKLSYKHRKKKYKNIINPLKYINRLYKSKSKYYNLYKSFLTKINLNYLNSNSQIILLQNPIYFLIYNKYKNKIQKYNTLNLIPFLLISLF